MCKNDGSYKYTNGIGVGRKISTLTGPHTESFQLSAVVVWTF